MRDTIKKITILLFYSLIVCIISIAYAENDTAQSKPQKEYYPDGQIKKESFQTKRKKIQKVYFLNGKLKFKQKVKLKTNERISTAYYKNGKVKSKLIQNPDDSGRVIGIWKYYGEDGKLNSEQALENGVYISTEHFRDHTSTSESGEYTIEIIYKKGKWKGRGGNFTRMYDKEGKLINETPLDETQRW
ncbi:toxin-antitoxin system YwqK family antitoxin [Fibrobacterota bacterium]